MRRDRGEDVLAHVPRDASHASAARVGRGTGEAATLAGPGLDALDEYFTRVVPAAVQAAVVPVVLGLRILMDDWVSAIVVALTIPLVPFFMILIGKHTRDRVDEVTDELARLADHLVELARGLPVLVGLGRADEQAAALDGIQRRLRRRTNATLRQAFLSALALELIATISVAVVAVFLGVRLVNGTVELQPAIAALVLAPECYAAIRAVGTAFHQAQDGTSALRRVRDVLDAPDAPAGFVRTESSDAAVPVRVRELTVRRPGRSVDAVHGASVDARRGEIVAITGPSGAGKSTVLAAIAELLGRTHSCTARSPHPRRTSSPTHRRTRRPSPRPRVPSSNSPRADPARATRSVRSPRP